MLRTSTPWPAAPAPGINTTIPHSTLLAMRQALRAVDLDIERTGSVSAESVDKVRDARALLEGRQ